MASPFGAPRRPAVTTGYDTDMTPQGSQPSSPYGAGSIYGNLLGQGFQNRRYAREEGTNSGASWGRFIRDIGEAAGGAAAKKWPKKTSNPWLPDES